MDPYNPIIGAEHVQPEPFWKFFAGIALAACAGVVAMWFATVLLFSYDDVLLAVLASVGLL
ncbi:MAG TPA: hypothetical protein VF516_03345 [Kofleriaceae bacterium]